MNVSAYKLGSWWNTTLNGPPAVPDQEHTYNRLFTHEKTTGPDRLKVGADRDSIRPLVDFIACLSSPLYVLYVLHVSRTGAELARYESPMLSLDDVVESIWTFSEFFQRDARHDVWVGSVNAPDLVGLDSHALLYAYGPLDCCATILHENAYEEGIVEIPAPHVHHYHVEFDQDEEQVLRYFDWEKRPLVRMIRTRSCVACVSTSRSTASPQATHQAALSSVLCARSLLAQLPAIVRLDELPFAFKFLAFEEQG